MPAAAALAGAALATVSLTSCGGPSSHRASTTTAAPPASSSSTTTAVPTAPVPAGFDPLSFTAVSDTRYWVLGSTPCAAGRCAAVVRTTDGGRTFASIPAPTVPVPGGGGTAQFPTLRFADDSDGFAFVPGPATGTGAFFATHDGGATWHALTLRSILAFATGGNQVTLVTAQCGSDGCTSLALERAPVSSDDFLPAPMPFATTDPNVALEAHGHDLWLMGTPAGTSSVQHVDLARSTDTGRTFSVGSGPCFPGLAGRLAATSSTDLWAVCATGTMASAAHSADSGLSFATLTGAPPMANSAVLAPASAAVAVLGADTASGGPLRTTDGGAHWAQVRTPGGAMSVAFVGFTDSEVGAAIVQASYDQTTYISQFALWRTTDGGATWSSVSF